MKMALSVVLLIGIFYGAALSARGETAAPTVKAQPAEGAQQFAALGDLNCAAAL
jgi:hypothetical protein